MDWELKIGHALMKAGMALDFEFGWTQLLYYTVKPASSMI